ncbi:MAG TPA: response regulator [Phycisphaerae bacterium]|nr:response regulator [Phycisphaerae bacterium]
MMTKTKNETILIIEDERSIRSLIRTYLETEGYTVREAGGGAEGLEAIRESVPDVVLLDLSMPPPQGMDVLRAIRQSAMPRKPAVIILTAYGSVKLAVEAMKLGALDFLEKPASPEVLLETVSRVHRERELAQDSRVDSYEVLLARARMALTEGELGRAEALLLRASPMGQRDPAFHNLLGLLTELRENFADARRHYGKAISLDRDYAPAQQNMRRMYELREFGHSNEPGAL